jgi:hypothetical protein
MQKINSNFNLRFLLAQLHMDSLANQPTRGHIKDTLKKLPKGVDETYEQAMKRIGNQAEGLREMAKSILSWLIYARRTLSTAELQHALAVKSRTKVLNRDFIHEIEMLGSLCAGLVTVDVQSNIVRVVHYTTQEYFERTQKRWFPDTETDIAKTCVTYLSFDTFDTGFCATYEEFEARLQENALYDYAAQNWGHHARTAPPEVEQLILGFLESEAKVSASSQTIMAFRDYSGYSHEQPKRTTGVHLAAYFGLRGVIIALLNNRHDPDSKDSYGRTPLSYAAVVQLLLARDDVDANSKDNDGRTPLSRAARIGHEVVAQLLLARANVDANVNSKDNDGRTPLCTQP